MYKIGRRDFLTGTAALLAFIATGCGEGGGGGNNAGSVTWLNDETDTTSLTFLKSVVRDYKHDTGVSLNLDGIATGDKLTKSLTAARAARPYDLSNMNPLEAAVLDQDKLISDIHTVIDAAGGESAFLPHTLYKMNGQYKWFCISPHTNNIYYRKDWLEEAGVGLPKTWDELRSVCEAFRKRGRGGITIPMAQNEATYFEGSHILWSNDVRWLDVHGNVVLDQGDNKRRCVEALEFLKELSQYFPQGMPSADYPQIINTFVNEVAGIAGYAGRLLETVITKAPQLQDRIAIGGFPTPDASRPPVATFTADGVVVFRPGHSDAAIQFLTWFVKHRLVDWLLTVPLQLLPPTKPIYDDKHWLANEQIQKYKWAVDAQRKIISGDGYQVVGLEVVPPGPTPAVAKAFNTKLVGKMYQQVVLAGTPPSQVVEQAAGELRQAVGAR